MPELGGLLLEHPNEMRMGVAQAGDRDAAGEVQIPPAVGGVEIGALAPLEGEIDAPIGRHHGWNHARLLRPEGPGS